MTRDDLRRAMRVSFSAEQMDAITAPLEPALVSAGAGSGKTTVMAARVVWLVGTAQITPDRVLGLTFTNKAATELRERVCRALVDAGISNAQSAMTGAADPTVLTYHSYASQLLREHGLRIGHEPDTDLLTDASRFQLAELAVRRHQGAIEHLTPSLSTVVRQVLQLDAQLSEHLVTPDQLRAWQAGERACWEEGQQTAAVRQVLATMTAREELLDLVADYRRLKNQRGVMDFADSMALSAMLAERCTDVRARERERFGLVLLDEYQDTSATQTRLLAALFGAGHPVTAVGDACQAIYGWRGASAGNLDAFPRTFCTSRAGQPQPAPLYALSVNRRSCRDILDTANVLAAPLHHKHSGSRPLQAPTDAQRGAVRAALAETFDDELNFIASTVTELHADPPGRRWSDLAVLVRDNAMGVEVHDRLLAADVPVEVVGVTGLLDLPEVRDVVATLEVLHDVTANSALLQLLTGPRWNIGPRDLALLGHRARELTSRREDRQSVTLLAALKEAVSGLDLADSPSLVEALFDPGDGRYSTAARERFAELATELRRLSRHVGEPLLELVRRVIDTIGIDVELAASNSPHADARRDNLGSFVDAVAVFAGTGVEASLGGLLAYLHAEEAYGDGLPLAVPSQRDSVKVLTVHKAKGLEWDVVFVPGLSRDAFPAARLRPRWTTVAAELPWPLRGDADELPSISERSRAGLEKFREACVDQQREEERRLAYVAFTRAREVLVASGHWWGPRQQRPRGPSEFLTDVLSSLRLRGAAPDLLAGQPLEDETNPADRRQVSKPWPGDSTSEELVRRRSAAELVLSFRDEGRNAAVEVDSHLQPDERGQVDQWDTEITTLLNEAQAAAGSEVVVPLPTSISATAALRLRRDPSGFARDLARPMPRKPSASARFGTRFHSWVEAHVGEQQLLAPDDVPGRADAALTSEAELQKLADAFIAGPFGQLTPLRVEAPFTTVLAGQTVRGRIDAVYQTATGYLVVDWKTSRAEAADPFQLALYRMAWAELMSVPVTQVEAAFYYVRPGVVDRFDALPGRAELERIWSQELTEVESRA